MTTEPTDEDVERLLRVARDVMEADSREEEAGIVREYLRSGEVTLAPKPEPEPLWRLHDYQSLWAVQKRRGDDDLPEGDSDWQTRATFNKDIHDAQQRAEALCAELNGERPTHQHCDGDPIECSVQGMQGEWEEAKHQRDALRSRVKEMEAELAAARASSRSDWFARDEAIIDDPADLTATQAQPAEPLFTAEFEEADGDKVTLWLSGQSFELAEGQQVDVYPAGSRPAPRKVTGELTAEDMENARSKIRLYGKPHDGDYFMFLLINLNAILASKAGA